ncbi:hypothetical protein DXG01_009350 [Tephrocybe rancida]|nr:hypothetical protein DXG01_009350 [Tephrocybe rancida]
MAEMPASWDHSVGLLDAASYGLQQSEEQKPSLEACYNTPRIGPPFPEPLYLGSSIFVSSSMPLVGAAYCPTEATPLLQSARDDDAFQKEALITREVFWEELRILPRYAFPVLGSQLLEYSMLIVNVISIGHLSTTALAAASLGTMTAGVTGFSMLHGLASGLETLLPASFTSSQPQMVGLWTQRMGICRDCVCSCARVLRMAKRRAYIPSFEAGPRGSPFGRVVLAMDVVRFTSICSEHRRPVSSSHPLFEPNLINSNRRYFHAQRLFSVQTSIFLFVAPINALANYILVWGPAPVRLGFIGAPIATIMSYNLIALASFVYAAFFLPRTAWHPLSVKMFSDLGILVRLGLSGIAQVTSQWWAWEFATLATSYMGPTTLAAHSILTTTCSMSYQLHSANANAAIIRIGNLLGERNSARAQIASRASLLIALFTAAFTYTTLLITRTTWPRLFNGDPVVVDLVSKILPILALSQFIDAVTAMGAGFLRVRGMQTQRNFVVCLPLGLWLAFKCDLGLRGLWFGMTLALAFNSAFGVILWSRTDWENEVSKAAERNAREVLYPKAQKIEDEESSVTSITVLFLWVAMELLQEMEEDNNVLLRLIYIQRQDTQFSSLDTSNYEDVISYFMQSAVPPLSDKHRELVEHLTHYYNNVQGEVREEVHASLCMSIEEIHRILHASKGEDTSATGKQAYKCLTNTLLATAKTVQTYHGLGNTFLKFQEIGDLGSSKGTPKYEVLG